MAEGAASCHSAAPEQDHNLYVPFAGNTSARRLAAHGIATVRYNLEQNRIPAVIKLLKNR